MSVGNYIVGLVLGLLSLAAIFVGARSLRRALLGDVSGPPAWVADGVLLVALLVVALELVGVLGLLDRLGAVTGCVAVGAGATLLGGRMTAPPSPRWRAYPPG